MGANQVANIRAVGRGVMVGGVFLVGVAASPWVLGLLGMLFIPLLYVGTVESRVWVFFVCGLSFVVTLLLISGFWLIVARRRPGLIRAAILGIAVGATAMFLGSSVAMVTMICFGI